MRTLCEAINQTQNCAKNGKYVQCETFVQLDCCFILSQWLVISKSNPIIQWEQATISILQIKKIT